MLLWIFIALLTGAAVMAVLRPLARPPATKTRGAEARRIYLDQIAELDRDRAAGRIGAAEAEAARAEIGRRLIAAEREAAAPDRPDGSLAARRATALLALAGIPFLSLGLYLGMGAPDLPGQPLAARLQAPSGPDDIERLVARVEEHLARAPEDGQGWDVIAPVYLRLGRTAEAAAAYRNAIRLLGSSGARQNGLGEALLALEGGIVTAEARAAFAAASAAEPSAPGPRFFLALAKEQEGDLPAAAAGWRALLAETPADAPWRANVEAALARVEGPAAEGSPAPAAAASDAEQAAMIEGMVNGLAERLQREPEDVEGWLRLIRSYAVLGRTDQAARAARSALEGLRDQGGRARVEALMAELALPPSGEAIP